jgi:hypothetical protein
MVELSAPARVVIESGRLAHLVTVNAGRQPARDGRLGGAWTAVRS